MDIMYKTAWLDLKCSLNFDHTLKIWLFFLKLGAHQLGKYLI